MTGKEDRGLLLPDDSWMRVWQENSDAAPDPERLARTIMAQVWRFDQKLFWRNFREYAAGIVLMVVFAGQIALAHDRAGGVVGFISVGFVMGYLWWKHRGLRPLDPAADIEAYRAALLGRFDDQIRLLRSVTYWYLLPLFIPPLWQMAHAWSRSPWVAGISLAVVAALYAFIGWLNVIVAVRWLRAARDKVESMSSRDER